MCSSNFWKITQLFGSFKLHVVSSRQMVNQEGRQSNMTKRKRNPRHNGREANVKVLVTTVPFI